MNAFRITYDTGNTTETNFNGTLKDAEDYYLGNVFTRSDDPDSGHEIKEIAIKVEQIN